MIDYDKPELPKDDLDFLIKRYSSEKIEIADNLTK